MLRLEIISLRPSKGFLQSDFKRSAIRLFTDAEYVSAQIDDGALYISAYKIFLQPVGDKSLCNRAEVDGGVRAAKGEYVAIQAQAFPVDTEAASLISSCGGITFYRL